MDENQIIDSALTAAYKQAPPYIKDYIAGGKFEAFMGTLTTHFGLHADVAGKVSNEILMTIIGMTPPAELPDNLKNEAGVAEGLINPILEELNTEVFVPLRESLEKAPEKETVSIPQPVMPAAENSKWIEVTPAAVVAPVQSIPTPAPAPTIPPSIAPTYIPPVQAPVTPVVQAAPAQTPAYTAPTVAPAPAAAPEYHEVLSMMRTMSKDIEALKGGTQPKMEPWKPISVPVTPGVSEPYAPPVQISTSVPQTPVQPIIHSSETMSATPELKSVASPLVHERISTPPQSGGGDPYREPVE